MLEREFRRLLVKRYGFKKLFELALSSIPLLAGSFFIYELRFTDWHTQFSSEEVMSATKNIHIFNSTYRARSLQCVQNTEELRDNNNRAGTRAK